MSFDSRVTPAGSAPLSPPPGTRITCERAGDGVTVWHIPAGSEAGGLFAFAILWCAFTACFSVGILPSILRSPPRSAAESIAFLAVFWVAGFGLLYAGLRQKYAHHRLSIDPAAVVLTRYLFGRAKTKSLPTAEVQSVALVEFYRQNYQPVRGIEIRGQGRLRFGSVLTAEEKIWLAGDIRAAIFGTPAPEWPPGPRANFSVALPHGRKELRSFGISACSCSVVFFIGSFFFDRSGVVPAAELMWMLRLFSGVSACAGIGHFFWLGFTGNRETRLEGVGPEVALRTYDSAGRILREQLFQRSAITDLRPERWDTFDHQEMKRIDLFAEGRKINLRHGVSPTEANAFVDEARAALGFPPCPPDQA